MLEYIKAQIEWSKCLFAEDKVGNCPSHKNVMSLAIVICFLIAFMKKTLASDTIQDIPEIWAWVLIGILGIRSVESIIKKNKDDKNE